MILEIISKPFAYLSYRQVKRTEKQLGSKLVLNQNGNSWIDGTMTFDMAPVWKKYEIEATGVNYFTIGEASNVSILMLEYSHDKQYCKFSRTN